MGKTILWHDYETTGAEPRRDRPLQFACLRSTEDLEVVGEPLVFFCRMPEDVFPNPDSCLITGLTPARMPAEALSEVELMRRVLRELALPLTCAAGYGSLRFDDEITRFGFWRCLLPVYEREWQNGNSRWDIVDVARATYALRPAGIEWPRREDGMPSFRLQDLTKANGIEHADAHDALADVRATLDLARLLRGKQPDLYSYLFHGRGKTSVKELLSVAKPQPLLHVSGRFPNSEACTSAVLPLCVRRGRQNEVILVDLRHDPEPLLSLPITEIRKFLFTPRDQKPAGAPRIGLKTVNVSQCPVLAPFSVLRDPGGGVAERTGLDVGLCESRAARLLGEPQLISRLREIYDPTDRDASGDVSGVADAGSSGPLPPPPADPDQGLYSGGFLVRRDRTLCEEVHTQPAESLRALEGRFADPRLSEILFRFRARNHPATLDDGERERWQTHCRQALTEPVGDKPSRMDQVVARIAILREERKADARAQQVLDEVDAAARARLMEFGIAPANGSSAALVAGGRPRG